jgi:hypothetical protein
MSKNAILVNTIFGARGSFADPNRVLRADFKYVISFSPSPSVLEKLAYL